MKNLLRITTNDLADIGTYQIFYRLSIGGESVDSDPFYIKIVNRCETITSLTPPDPGYQAQEYILTSVP